LFLLQSAGIEEQGATQYAILRIKEPGSRYVWTDKWARFEPYHGFKLDFTIDFPHPVFGTENRHVVIDFAEHSLYQGSEPRPHFSDSWRNRRGDACRGAGARRQPAERDRARRDARLEQRRPALRQRVAIHKVLDAIGDLYLLGHPLDRNLCRVQVRAYATLKTTRLSPPALLARPEAWELVTFDAPPKCRARFCPGNYSRPDPQARAGRRRPSARTTRDRTPGAGVFTSDVRGAPWSWCGCCCSSPSPPSP